MVARAQTGTGARVIHFASGVGFMPRQGASPARQTGQKTRRAAGSVFVCCLFRLRAIFRRLKLRAAKTEAEAEESQDAGLGKAHPP